jgi:hypothetical protein
MIADRRPCSANLITADNANNSPQTNEPFYTSFISQAAAAFQEKRAAYVVRILLSFLPFFFFCTVAFVIYLILLSFSTSIDTPSGTAGRARPSGAGCGGRGEEDAREAAEHHLRSGRRLESQK